MATHQQTSGKNITFGKMIKGLFKNLFSQKEPAERQVKAKVNPSPQSNSVRQEPSRSRKRKSQKARMAAKRAKNQAQAVPERESVDIHHAVTPNVDVDPAHRPGHRTFDVKSQFTEATGDKTHIQPSAMNNVTASDRAQILTSPQRRINSGRRARSSGKTSH